MIPAETSIDTLLKPLSGESGCGNDPRASEDFLAIGEEIAKIGNVDLVAVDWTLVTDRSAKVLRECAKDLRCGVYWAIGTMEQEGVTSLATGALLISRLVSDFGTNLYPTRSRTRSSIIAWFAERVALALEAGPVSVQADELELLTARMDELALQLEGIEVDAGPVRTVQTRLHTGVVLELSSEEKVAAVRSQFAPEFAELAMAMLGHESVRERSPLGIRMHRWALWANEPDIIDGRIPGSIDPSAAAELEELSVSQSWPQLLDRAESEFAISPFWLDLTYYVASAAHHTFGPHASLAVVGLTRDLLTRCPELVQANDQDGVPLASEATLAWLQAEVQLAPSADSPAAAPEMELPLDLQGLLQAGDLHAALSEASKWIDHAEGRVRFGRSVAVANAFSDMGASQNAHVVFRGLHNHLRQLTVKDWDPAIFTSCLCGFLSTKRDAFGLGPEDEMLMDELSAMDPAALLALLAQ